MGVHAQKWLAGLAALLLAACASDGQAESKSGAREALVSGLASPSRPLADRERDADRKPADLMMIFGVERGMTAVDIMAGGGFMTAVLSVAVGSEGKVYAQNQAANTALGERLAGGRLANVVPITGDLSAIPPDSADVVITVMNLHDVYNSAGS